MRDYLIKIENDLLDVASRVRSVDEGLFVCYNRKSGKFELHNARFANTFQTELPFERLDARTIGFAYKTHVKNRAALIEETDRHNERLAEQAVRDAAEKAAAVVEAAL